MADERTTERTDGVTTERTTETSTPHTTVVERGGGSGVLIGIILVVLIAVLAWFLFMRNDQEARETDAVTGAASQVGQSAERAADSVEKAVDGNSK